MNRFGITRPSVLLVEPESLLRKTVAAVARELRLAEIHEATGALAAEPLLGSRRFDAVVVGLDGSGAALQLVQDLRADRFRTERDVPIAVMAASCNLELIETLKALDVRRIVLKPFKVKTILETVHGLLPALAEH